MKLRKLNRVTHRDIGYLIVGMTLIYAVSGIAINHKNDWNPNYLVDQRHFTTDISFERDSLLDQKALQLLSDIGEEKRYKTAYFPQGNTLTIFLVGGTVQINTLSGEGYVEVVSKRPVLYQLNFLHYNPGKWWKIFSDIFCVALILVAITGLFIAKGKHSITRRGAILTAIGIILPLLFLFVIY